MSGVKDQFRESVLFDATRLFQLRHLRAEIQRGRRRGHDMRAMANYYMAEMEKTSELVKVTRHVHYG